MSFPKFCLSFAFVTCLSQWAPGSATAQPTALPTAEPPTVAAVAAAPKKEHWYDKIKLRGYSQLRFNRFPSFDYNENLINSQGDKSIGGNNGVFLRRARLILQGDVHDRVFIYLQPDFASSINDQLHVTILRDWYADISLDEKKEYRIRVGQSKVPFGFENMQSSSNRLPLDRNDALNSAVKDERDIGAFFYWAPAEIRKRFKHLVDSGLKGSGDYGVLALGVYNGQTANRPELNNNLHMVGRLTYPFLFGNQFIEVGGGGYKGKYTVKLAQPSDGTKIVSTAADDTYDDWRVHGSIIVYPQPFGFQAEFNAGRGPALGLNETHRIENRTLYGGYALLSYKHDTEGGQSIIPFVRGTFYEGGKKFEPNAPRYSVKELEMGVEWQPITALELVLAYNISDRTSDKYPYKEEQGHITRLQVQFNY